MQYLLVKEKCGFKCTWTKSVTGLHRERYTLYTHNYKSTLWTLMHLHLELCRIARELNSMFGMQITFEMVSYFTSISTICYGLFVMLTQEHREEISVYTWINISCWTSILVVRLHIINHICESVRVKAKEIDNIIHQLTSILRYTNIFKEFIDLSIHIASNVSSVEVYCNGSFLFWQ
ncbi:unnamed protein product [Lasius platythorax]|uniref:Gustatory receptor n=1 Tax=Lasius platythorax TaxID=488582 RepID=A0AAV2MYK7_9HYME